MRRSFRFLAILACALPLACSDTSTAPTATAPPPVPRLDANPASNGSLVFQGEWGWWWWAWTDTEKNLTVLHANFELPEAFCGGNPLWTPPSVQSVVSGKYSEEEQLVHFLLRAPEAFIYVFAGTGIPSCEAVPIASGVGHLVTTDSDLFAGDQAGRPQMDAFGVMAEGRLTGPDGRYHYSGHLRGQYHDGVEEKMVQINLQPLGR